jgi:hypothetical protein
MAKKQAAAPAKAKDERPVCFVIMPIRSYADRPDPLHFRKIYQQLFIPACDKAGFRTVRADDIKATSDININVVDQIINAPMALCDISALNPNCMFELGMRMAYDRPVALCQERGTERVFDIASISIMSYRRSEFMTSY